MQNAMRALIVGDDPALTSQLQSILQCNGFDCRPDGDIVPLQSVSDRTTTQTRQDLVLIVMPRDLAAGLRIIREMRTATAATIVAVGPAEDSKSVLTVLRQGADEYLDISDLEDELESTLGRLQARRGQNTRRGRVISVMGACGGCGTSSLAANLAVVFAKRNEHAALIDLRLGLGDQSLLLDLDPQHSLAAVCRNGARLDFSMFQRSLEHHSSGVQLLAAPSGWDECPDVTAQGIRKVVRLSRSQFPYVIVDLDNTFTAEQVSAIVSSDVILLVLQPGMLALKNARRLLETLDQLGVSEDRVQIVAGRVGQRGQLPIAKVQQALGVKVVAAIPEDPRNMNLASNKGVPIVIERPRLKVSKRIESLATVLENLTGVYDDARVMPPIANRSSATPTALESRMNGKSAAGSNGSGAHMNQPSPKGTVPA
jgi:pilus assembly protein CpaE